jgi:hypothetical protein
MNALLIVALVIAVALPAATVILLTVISVNVHREEWHRSMPAQPSICTQILTRKVLGFYVRRPDALITNSKPWPKKCRRTTRPPEAHIHPNDSAPSTSHNETT